MSPFGRDAMMFAGKGAPTDRPDFSRARRESARWGRTARESARQDAAAPPMEGQDGVEELLYRIAAGIWAARRVQGWIAAGVWVIAAIVLIGFLVGLLAGFDTFLSG